MIEVKQNRAQQEGEISLKELALNLREWWRYLLSKWIIIVVVGIAGAGLGLIYSLTQKFKYVGELTFILEENKSNPLGAYAGLASQFGVDLGGGSSVGVFTEANITEFLKSRLMVEKTLLSAVNVNPKSISLADLYIDNNKLREGWKEKPLLKNLHFPLNVDRKTFSLQQDSILNIIYQNIVKGNLTISKPDKRASFIAVTTTSGSEIFSKVFTERLVLEATDFYITTKTKRSKINIDKLQLKADSLLALLNKKTFSEAATQDLNMNPARQVATVGRDLISRDKLILQTIYGEVVKNLEVARMSMIQETPVIQIVDTPILPLKKEKLGKTKGLIIGGILGGFLIVAMLIVRRLYRKVIQ